MKLIIDNNSAIPIYEQLTKQIKSQIIDDTLKEDDQLPSVRNLAKDLAISIMTVKRAYDALEEEGFIITRQGKGSFVGKKNLNFAKEEKQKEIERYLEKIVDLATKYDISKEEVWEIFDYMWR